MFYSKLLVLMVDFQLQHLLLVGYSNKIIHAHNAMLNIILDLQVWDAHGFIFLFEDH